MSRKAPTIPQWPEGCHRPEECRASGFCEYDRCPHGAELVIHAQKDNAASKATDTPAQAAARAWLHSYGINTSRYVDGGGDHPAMRTLPQAFEAFARSVKDLPHAD